MFGVLCFVMAGICSLTAWLMCFPVLWDRPVRPLVRWLSAGAAAGAVGAAGSLLFALLQDQFQYVYVYEHSAVGLDFWYKVSAFWAGQEGSFLLWFLLQAGVGSILLWRQRLSDAAEFVYLGVQVLLAVFLFSQNPFVLGMPRADGMGLNPLLQDFWMVIHPPMVFLGYTALAVPFSCAIGSLWQQPVRRGWLSVAWGWGMLGWTALGSGIFMGAYWAYKTLGWGGYWGWDPVENASLVPWLSGAALLHFLRLAQQKAAFLRWACFTGWLTFSFVLYGTFLTRSGVLHDFSVHAFSAGGNAGVLAVGCFGMILVSLLPLFWRWRTLTGAAGGKTGIRNMLLVGAGIVLLAGASLVWIGMSIPLLSTLWGEPQSVAASYYNHSFLLPVLLLLLGMVVAPFGNERWRLPGKGMVGVLLLAVGSGAAAVSLGIVQPLWLLGISLATAAVVLQFWHAARLSLTARLAHAGAALLALGILLSSGGESTADSLVFPSAQAQLSVWGQELCYIGSEDAEDGQGFIHHLTYAGQLVDLQARLDVSGEVAIKKPAIQHRWYGDYYIADQGKSLSLSFKPMIGLVWSGCLLLIVSGCRALGLKFSK